MRYSHKQVHVVATVTMLVVKTERGWLVDTLVRDEYLGLSSIAQLSHDYRPLDQYLRHSMKHVRELLEHLASLQRDAAIMQTVALKRAGARAQNGDDK